MGDEYQEYLKNEKRTDYIPLKDCKKGFVYKIHSRNLSHGVYDGDEGFIGIRYKLGGRYLFTEYHWDGRRIGYGTVKPLEEIGQLPPNILCQEDLTHENGNLWADNEISGEDEPVLRRDLNENEPSHGKRQGFVDIWVRNGERLPDNLYPRLKGNDKLFEFLNSFK